MLRNQLDYILISNNIKTRAKYSKEKGAASTNQDNQHNLIWMEIRVKLKQLGSTPELASHVNLDIEPLRENDKKLLMEQDGGSQQ